MHTTSSSPRKRGSIFLLGHCRRILDSRFRVCRFNHDSLPNGRKQPSLRGASPRATRQSRVREALGSERLPRFARNDDKNVGLLSHSKTKSTDPFAGKTDIVIRSWEVRSLATTSLAAHDRLRRRFNTESRAKPGPTQAKRGRRPAVGGYERRRVCPCFADPTCSLLS